MKRSLFVKYFLVWGSVILAGITVLGFTLMVLVTQYTLREKGDLLVLNARNVAKLTADIEKNSLLSPYRRNESLQAIVSVFADNISSNIFITNTQGETLISSYREKPTTFSKIIPPKYMEQALDGKLRELTDLDGIYNKEYFVVGVPIILDGNNLAGAVFVSTDADSVTFILRDILNMFFISSIIVLLFIFIAIYLMTYRMTRPLREMAVAARRLGEGDFTARINIDEDRKDEIGELAHSFNSMSQSLSSLDTMRRSFVANVSHELKTPMTIISGYVDGILDGTIPESKSRHYLEIVSEEIKRLSKLTRSLLELAKIENQSIEMEYVRFDLMEAVRKVLLSFEQKIEEKKIRVYFIDDDHGTNIYADRDLIYQVIYNLIDNAVKFTETGGYIELEIKIREERAFVRIRNSGEGIPEHELSAIFERFYKTDKSRSNDRTGVGLGLFLIKKIINLHNGEIAVKSELGKYTEFAFYIPSKSSKN